MGVRQKITFLFLLIGTAVFCQVQSTYFTPGLLRASATIAPTRFYNQQTTVGFINGFVEYVLEDRISVRGEGNFRAPDGKLLFTTEPNSFPRNFTSLYAGFGYHFGKKNWKLDLHAEPGVVVAEMAQEPYATIPTNYQWSVSPSYMLKLGTSFYFSKFCHFFAEFNYASGWIRRTPMNSVSTDQYGVSAGLGFHLLTNKK